MAMFNKKGEKGNYVDSMTRNHLAHGTKVTGTIESEGAVRIDGEVIGSISSKSKVVIGQHGELKGNIEACNEAEIEGRIEGNVKVAGLLTIKKTGCIMGDIDVQNLVIEDGVHVGKTVMPLPAESVDTNPKLNGKQTKNKKVLATAN